MIPCAYESPPAWPVVEDCPHDETEELRTLSSRVVRIYCTLCGEEQR